VHPPGEILRRIRMALGLPLSKVARQSQLSVARIEALEAGDDACVSGHE
jgi:cytoskeletal protein RodZ